MTQDGTTMMILIVGLALIFLVIFGGLVLQVRKRQKAEQLKTITPESSQAQSSTEQTSAAAATSQTTTPKTEKPVEIPPPTTLKQALAQTEKNLFGRIRSLFASEVATKNLEDVEEILYTSDIGAPTVQRLLGGLEKQLSNAQKKDLSSIQSTLKHEFAEIFKEALIQEPDENNPFQYLKLNEHPTVWMIVGVNGAGKTTTIGKLASLLAKRGLKVLVAAGDTFRAAAGGQLKVWTERAQVEIFSPENVKDPSAVAYEAISLAKTKAYDIVLVDTAGRLHTQVNLMEELKKMKRVMTKVITDAPHETLIVLDGNSGQNALVQAREFHQALGLTGVVLTKMDGTARGGVAVGLAHELKVPIRFIGIGESIHDLRPFSSKEFIDSIFQ